MWAFSLAGRAKCAIRLHEASVLEVLQTVNVYYLRLCRLVAMGLRSMQRLFKVCV